MVFVRDVMTRDVIVIDPDRTVLDAAKRMAVKKIGGLVVVQHGRPIGLITDRDILWQVTSKGNNPSKVLVREVMTSPVATVSPLTTLRAAARVMLDKKTRWIVVTHLDNVEGIIPASDLPWGFWETCARASRRGIARRWAAALSSRKQPQEKVRPNNPADQVGEDEVPSTDRVTFLVQQGVEVIHRGVAHERNREQDRQADGAGPPHERLKEFEDPLADRMSVHPAFDEWVHLVPDEEDHNCANCLPEPEGDRFERGIEFRIQQEEKLDGDRQDDGRGNRVEEQAEEVDDDADRLQAELECGPHEYADVGPSLRHANGCG